MPVNNQINSNLQNILNLLPNLNVEALVRSMLVKTNDMHLAMYLAALVRSVLALHDLLNNKIQVSSCWWMELVVLVLVVVLLYHISLLLTSMLFVFA
jgi:hypothetical protein